jgi:uncharacterized iron-regulated membrane protein
LSGSVRRWLQRIHLWLGIAIALPVGVTAATGIILTWTQELAPIVDGPEWSANAGTESLGWPALIARVQKQQPQATILHVGGDPSGGYAMPVWLKHPETGVQSFLLDPGTGELVERRTQDEWLKWIEGLHRNLLMGAWGRQLVAVSSLVMVAIAVVGVVLWWPMRRGSLRGLLRRRSLLRWHNLVGLVVVPMMLLLALTGVTLTYNGTIFDALHRLAGSEAEVAAPEPRSSAQTAPLPQVFDAADDAVNDADVRRFSETRDGAVYELRLREPGAVHPAGWHVAYVDASTGELLRVTDKRTGTWATWYEQMWYVLHTGSLLPAGPRAVWALASLGVFALAVTGVWHWYSRHRRRRRNARR